MSYIERYLTSGLTESLRHFPVVAVIGPRQCGKSTLIKNLPEEDREYLHLDLERQSDLRKLDEAEWYLNTQRGKTICLDEIQRKPEIFQLIRTIVDEWDYNGSFIVLGSASRELLHQSSESLAGRISYKRLTPFLWSEAEGEASIEHYLLRGGFPRSFLAENNSVAMEWKENFISTFIERDLLQWTGSSPLAVRRLWEMLAHVDGQTVNYSGLGNSLGISNVTVKNYIDILQSTFMVEIVSPHIINTGKRLVKSPKVYINDSGIISGLLHLKDFDRLAGHPVFGSLWEGVVLANLRGHFPGAEIRYYRTSHGAELDFVMLLDGNTFAIECKASLAPSLSRGSYTAIEDLNPKHTFVVSPVQKGYSMKKGVDVVSLSELMTKLQEFV